MGRVSTKYDPGITVNVAMRFASSPSFTHGSSRGSTSIPYATFSILAPMALIRPIILTPDAWADLLACMRYKIIGCVQQRAQVIASRLRLLNPPITDTLRAQGGSKMRTDGLPCRGIWHENYIPVAHVAEFSKHREPWPECA